MPANFSLVVVRRMEPCRGQWMPWRRMAKLDVECASSWISATAEISLARPPARGILPSSTSVSYSMSPASSEKRSRMVPWSPVTFHPQFLT